MSPKSLIEMRVSFSLGLSQDLSRLKLKISHQTGTTLIETGNHYRVSEIDIHILRNQKEMEKLIRDMKNEAD